MVHREKSPVSEETRGLFEVLDVQSNIDPKVVQFAPYIRLKDAASEHDLQVREWGAYQLLANPRYASDPECLWNASGYRRGHDLLLVVGNMNNHRTSWLIIKTFELDASAPGPTLFDGIE